MSAIRRVLCGVLAVVILACAIGCGSGSPTAGRARCRRWKRRNAEATVSGTLHADCAEGFSAIVILEDVDDHAVLHPDLPNVTNVGYFLAGTLFHPGDALTVPDRPVGVLALPVGAPWLAVRDAIDYMRAVRPRIAVGVHERALGSPQLSYGLLERFAADQGTRFVVLEGDDSLTV